ncbi:MAG: bacterial Ig-like domain-containing protein, partial [Treponema sp.]|nr:bacterial Ig-like domain-containing protein [Treponema sp.]
AEFTVTVREARLVSIAVSSLPEKTVYRKGESFNRTGLVVTGTYEDGSSREETAYKIPLVNTTSAGEKTVTLSLGNLTAEFKIFVSDGSLLSIAISREPDRKSLSWGEALDLSGIEVTGTFSDIPDTPIIISVGSKNVSGYDPSLLPGEQTVTLTVEGKTASFTVYTAALFFDYGKPRIKGEVVTGSYSVPLGRTLVLAPVRWGIGDNAVYEWKVDGVVQPGVVTECFSFKPKTRKTYTVSVSARDGEAWAEASTQVRCVDRVGTYKRPKTAESKAYITDLLGYYPAPGQFTGSNSGYNPYSKPWDPANNSEQLYSLGAFGGSIVYGFDHSVENTGGYSLIIHGNAFPGWSEPGTVWVMQDENGNGEADDTWYELAGSETGKPTAKQRYALAYAGNGSVDNMGDYGPAAGSGNYTIYCGTRLLDKVSTDDGGIITNGSYGWGYVDNAATSGSWSSFRISDAIQADGTPADLKYIDFVRVQTALSNDAGALGEISTETGIAFDYEMDH